MKTYQKKKVFSLSRGVDKVEVLEGYRGGFDVQYFYSGDKKPVVVGVSSLPMAMELVRSFEEETATVQ